MKDLVIDEMSFIYAVFQRSASLTLQNQKDLLRLDELSSSGNTFVDAPSHMRALVAFACLLLTTTYTYI